MNVKQMNKEIDATLASLDEVRPCLASESFAQRVLTLVTISAKETSQTDWQPNLALAMAVMLIFLNGAALTWTWKAQTTKTRSKILREIALEGRDTTLSFFPAKTDERSGGF